LNDVTPAGIGCEIVFFDKKYVFNCVLLFLFLVVISLNNLMELMIE
jgi:hypothetical protein